MLIKSKQPNLQNRQQSNQTGFTIVELMISLAILSVLLLFAVPAFNDFTAQQRMATNVNALISAINLARSEAGRRGGRVTVQAVDASDGDNEWGPGFCVAADDPGDCAAPLATFLIEGNVTLDATADFNNEDSISYDSMGLQTTTNTGTFRLCGQDTDDDPGRVVNLNAVGRPTVRDLDCF